MRDGIPVVIRRNNSIHLWLWGDVQHHSIVLSNLPVVLLLFATYAFLPVHQVKTRLFGTPYELRQSAVKTAD